MFRKGIVKCLLYSLFLSNLILAQTTPFYFTVDYPKFVPENKNFDISITSRFDSKFGEIYYYVFSENGISIDDVTLRSFDYEKRLKAREVEFDNEDRKTYRIKLPLDDSQFTLSNTFQLDLKVNPNSNRSDKISFAVETKAPTSAASVTSFFYNHNFPQVKFSSYRPQTTSGKSLLFKENSEFSFNINDRSKVKNLLVEFWAKFDGPVNNFFVIENNSDGDTLISLSNNKFFVTSLKDEPGLKIFGQCFEGRNAWTHYTIRLSQANQLAEMWANDALVFSFPFYNEPSLSNLLFSLNGNSKSQFQIDLFKVWDFNNSVDLSFYNKNYLSYYADSSSVLMSLNFDDENQLNNLYGRSNMSVEISNVSFRNSDAPIFSRAPELNLTTYDNFYLLEWSGRDVKNAKTYVLEKTDKKNNNFQEIYSADADNDLSRVYSFTDIKDPDMDIVSYRIKQLNKDGTATFSSSIKIGQGEKKPFVIDQNYPNPFNPVTSIMVEIVAPTDVTISVYDLVGKKIAELYSGYLQEGKYTFNFDGSQFPSGIYFYEVKTPKFQEVRKMILAK